MKAQLELGFSDLPPELIHLGRETKERPALSLPGARSVAQAAEGMGVHPAVLRDGCAPSCAAALGALQHDGQRPRGLLELTGRPEALLEP